MSSHFFLANITSSYVTLTSLLFTLKHKTPSTHVSVENQVAKEIIILLIMIQS